MQIDFLTVLIAVASLIVLALPGYILVKTKLLPSKAGEAFSALVLYGCQPMLVFMGFQGAPYSAEIGMNMLIVAGIAVAVHLIMAVIMYTIIRNKDRKAKLNVVRCACVFGNCGYMGFPFLQMLFGGGSFAGEITIYGAVVISVFNILNWTLGVYMITGDKKDISIKKVLLNPTIIAVVLGFIVFITVKVPLVQIAAEGTTAHMIISKFVKSFNYIGDMVTPLAMMVIGVRLANVNLKQLFLDKWAYFVCFFKLVVMSIITMLIVSFLPIATTVKYSLFFLLSMPSATSTALYAVKFNSDGDSASVIVLLTTVMCILTIPLLFLLFTGAFGVVM